MTIDPRQKHRLIALSSFSDPRGSFTEVVNSESMLYAHGIEFSCCQINRSISHKNVIRGLHYQQGEHAQAKIVSVLKGNIFDVVVDLRQDSKNFGEWTGIYLTDKDEKILYIPAGFAHGFVALSDNTKIEYYTDAPYRPEAEVCLIWDDEGADIDWPLNGLPILSDKDSKGLPFASCPKF